MIYKMSVDYHDTVFDIIHLVDTDEDRFLDLAALLRKLKDRQPKDFVSIIEWPKLGRRKAYYLLEIDEAFGDKANLHPRLAEIGWTKAAKIAKFVTPENTNDLLELAERYTALELELLLKGAEIKPGTRFVMLRLDPEQFALFRGVLLKYGAKAHKKGLLDKEAALVEALSKLA